MATSAPTGYLPSGSLASRVGGYGMPTGQLAPLPLDPAELERRRLIAAGGAPAAPPMPGAAPPAPPPGAMTSAPEMVAQPMAPPGRPMPLPAPPPPPPPVVMPQPAPPPAAVAPPGGGSPPLSPLRQAANRYGFGQALPQYGPPIPTAPGAAPAAMLTPQQIAEREAILNARLRASTARPVPR